MINLNVTLFGQMITFALFVWFTMRYVWPPIMKAMQDRQDKIAEGLAAAEQGVKKLELADRKYEEMILDAKSEATKIIDQANNRANKIIDESKVKAKAEGERLLQLAKTDIEQEYNAAKEALVSKVSSMAAASAKKILQREITVDVDADIVNDLVGEL